MLPNIASISQSLILLTGLKIGFLMILSLYFIFILVVFKQITSMDTIISEIHFSLIIKIVSIVNIALALSLFLAALVIL
jgi:hypothetical protein